MASTALISAAAPSTTTTTTTSALDDSAVPVGTMVTTSKGNTLTVKSYEVLPAGTFANDGSLPAGDEYGECTER